MERTPADHMGMLATMINGISLAQALKSAGCSAKVFSALDCPQLFEQYSWQKASEYLPHHILIFVAGIGLPYFSTDTCAALRAAEIQADVVLKATKVDGIYTKDPLKYSDAVKYDTISYDEILAQKLDVMDAASIAICRTNQIPVVVFNMSLLNKTQNILSLLSHENIGTLVTP